MRKILAHKFDERVVQNIMDFFTRTMPEQQKNFFRSVKPKDFKKVAEQLKRETEEIARRYQAGQTEGDIAATMDDDDDLFPINRQLGTFKKTSKTAQTETDDAADDAPKAAQTLADDAPKAAPTLADDDATAEAAAAARGSRDLLVCKPKSTAASKREAAAARASAPNDDPPPEAKRAKREDA